MLKFNKPSWGPENTNLDYTFLMAGETPISKPIDLTGHTLTGLSPERSDALKLDFVERVRGQTRQRRKTIRKSEILEWTMNIGLSTGGKIWTPVMQKARLGLSGCPTDFYLIRDCPPSNEHAHAWIYIDGQIDEPEPVNDPVVASGTGDFVDEQAPVSLSKRQLMYAVGGFRRYVASAELYAVEFFGEDCTGCSDVINANIIAVGGNGTAAMLVVRTTDRFANVTTPNTSAAATGSIGQDVHSNGDLIIIPFSNDVLAEAASGGVLVSSNSGTTLTAAASLPAVTPPALWGATGLPGIYYICGGNTGAQSVLYESTNGNTWTSVSSPALPSTKALLAIDADTEEGNIYIVGESGTMLKGTIAGGATVVSALTPPGSPGHLRAVKVLGTDHVAIAGANGYYAETFDGGTNWTRPIVNAGTDTIYSIAGDRFRTMMGAAEKVDMRDVISEFDYNLQTLQEGVILADNVRGMAMAEDEEGFNTFVAVTDNNSGSDVIVFEPFHPGA